MNHREIKIQITEFNSESELDLKDAQLLDKAKEALEFSYSPYSRFKVGAAILLENGKVILGSNQENASFPAGICAERTAIYNATHQFKDVKFIAIAITVLPLDFEVTSPIAPCGVCRQVMLETELQQEQDYKVILKGSKGKIYTLPSASSLLPLYFFEKGLKKKI
ncbi:MAG: cytidine deaminase [Flavobacteriales bacterium]